MSAGLGVCWLGLKAGLVESFLNALGLHYIALQQNATNKREFVRYDDNNEESETDSSDSSEEE